MLYLGNYASEVDYECLRDDGYEDGVETMAHPSGFILEDNSPAHVQALLDSAWEDLTYGDEGGEPDWTTNGWQESGRHQRWESKKLNAVAILRVAKPLEPVGGPA